MSKRKYVVFTSRVHPGESGCSFIMKGIIDYLMSDHPVAVSLRELFVFKIVPMLNIDGVVEGNQRCSLASVDLNRCWLEPSPQMQPTIYHTKQMMKQIIEHDELLLFVDLHCHFRKKKIFIYGCDETESTIDFSSNVSSTTEANNSVGVRVFPHLLSQRAPCFSFSDCSFKVC